MTGTEGMTWDEDPPEADVRTVSEGLDRFNAALVGSDNHEWLNVVARDSNGIVAGGLLGGTYWGWLHVERLWVREDMRGRGIGSALLERAEGLARARGCRYAHLDTMDFQAPEFYKARGYRVMCELPELPAGHSKILLMKELAPPARQGRERSP